MLDDAENNTDNPLTVDLTRCELWVKTGDNDKAIELLQRVLYSYPNNPRALHIMAQASQNAGQWQQLREILPKVKKLEILLNFILIISDVRLITLYIVQGDVYHLLLDDTTCCITCFV